MYLIKAIVPPGIATQTILTIPVNHVNSNDQMVNLALNNGQVVSTSLANLQAMAQPHQLLNSTPQQSSNIRPNMLNPSLSNALMNPGLPNFLSNGASNAQELLQALQQQPQTNHLLQTVQQNNANSMPQMQVKRASSPKPDRHYKERENFERYAAAARERNERENSGATSMNSINRLVVLHVIVLCFCTDWCLVHSMKKKDSLCLIDFKKGADYGCLSHRKCIESGIIYEIIIC